MGVNLHIRLAIPMSQPMRKCARKLTKTEEASESAGAKAGSKAKEFTEVWQACESDYTVQVVMSVGRDVECAIMQDRVDEVVIEGLPSSWPVLSDSTNSDAVFKCATLPCGHSFHPSAIALHFAASDMRCPVCREGCEKPLDVNCLPVFVGSKLAQKTDAVNRVHDIAPTVESLHAIMSRLQLHVQIGSPHPRYTSTVIRQVVNTRLVMDIDVISQAVEELWRVSSPADSEVRMVEFNVHRSFQRILRNVVERQLDHNSSVVFTLSHPFLPVYIGSVEMSVKDMYDSLFNVFTMSGSVEACRGSVALFCLEAAGTQAVARLQTSFSGSNALTNITMNINVSMIYNIAVDFLQRVEHDMPNVEFLSNSAGFLAMTENNSGWVFTLH